jgi:hypothetical protein
MDAWRASEKDLGNDGLRGRNTRERSGTVADQLRGLDCDPIAGMAKLAQDKTVSSVLRARISVDLAHYVAPRAKAADLTGPTGIPLELASEFNMEKLTDQELETLAYLLEKGGR